MAAQLMRISLSQRVLSDNTGAVPDSPYILAKWKSLSNTGFGILVKVNGLNLGNYSDTIITYQN